MIVDLKSKSEFTPLQTWQTRRWGACGARRGENSWGPRRARPSAATGQRSDRTPVSRAIPGASRSPNAAGGLFSDNRRRRGWRRRGKRERSFPHAREVRPVAKSVSLDRENRRPAWRGGSSVVTSVVTRPASKVEGPARIHSRWVIVMKIMRRSLLPSPLRLRGERRVVLCTDFSSLFTKFHSMPSMLWYWLDLVDSWIG